MSKTIQVLEEAPAQIVWFVLDAMSNTCRAFANYAEAARWRRKHRWGLSSRAEIAIRTKKELQTAAECMDQRHAAQQAGLL